MTVHETLHGGQSSRTRQTFQSLFVVGRLLKALVVFAPFCPMLAVASYVPPLRHHLFGDLKEEGRLPIRVYLTLPHEELEKESSAAGESGIGGGDGGRGNGGDDDDGGGGSSGGDGDKDTAGMGGGKPEPWSGDKGLVSWNRVKLFSDGSLGA